MLGAALLEGVPKPKCPEHCPMIKWVHTYTLPFKKFTEILLCSTKPKSVTEVIVTFQGYIIFYH